MNSDISEDREIEDIYPLSPMQEGMLFHSLLEPESGVYIEQLCAVIDGDLDIASFKKAWQKVIDRHSILRTSFIWEEIEKPLQVVYRKCEIGLQVDDWSGFSTEIQEKRLIDLLNKDRQTPYNFDDPPLMRLFLIRFSEENYRFIWSSHHILFDGWSFPILLKEVFFSYEDFHAGKQPILEPVRNYREYIAWLQKQNVERANYYWEELLEGFEEPTPIVLNKIPRMTAKMETGHQLVKRGISLENSINLRNFAQENGLTINTIFQGIWGMLLHLYSGEDDIVFGATVSGRSPELPGSERMLGLFINTIPVRLLFTGSEPLVPWLINLQLQGIRSRQFEYTPLVQIQKSSAIPSTASLFDSILVFENFPVEPAIKEQKGSLEIRDVRHFASTNYPLTIIGAPGLELEVHISYDSDIISSETATRLIAHICLLLEKLPELKGNTPIQEFLQAVFGQIPFSYRENYEEQNTYKKIFIHELIDHQAEITPEAIALFSNDDQLTYNEFKLLTNRIGHYLQNCMMGYGKRIGVCLKRSTTLISIIVGILKAGYSYVPIDPKLPLERIAFILEDSSVTLVITEDDFKNYFKLFSGKTLIIEDLLDKLPDYSESTPMIEQNHIDDAYVIYTSGTTGVPKGVLIGHHQLINHSLSMANAFGIREGILMLQFISIGFDAAGEEIYPTLTSGGTLVMAPDEFEPSGREVLDFCEKNYINILHLPVAFWHQIVSDIERENLKIPPSLNLLAVGGEKPHKEKLLSWAKALDHPMKFVNLFGPTEATITAVSYTIECNTELINKIDEIPIGKPISNITIQVMNKFGQVCPIGVPGELFIGGICLANGYINRLDLTLEKFPLLQNDQRFYATGDQVVLLEDQNLYFIGRNDDQVKWRGYRIELGEIENILLQCKFVKDATVLISELDSKEIKLVAYIVAVESQFHDESLIRDFLRGKLSEYMIPSAFIFIDKFPLTLSGKINKKNLPSFNEYRSSLIIGQTLPRNATEEILCGIIQDILGVDKVGVEESFFDLGGHSLLATQFVSRIRVNFNVDYQLRKLFDSPSIGEITEEINRLKKDQGLKLIPDITPVPRTENVPLSFSQQRLWFIDQLEPGASSFNIPTAVRFSGDLNIQILKRSLEKIIQRHEALRTIFISEGGKPVQKILPDIEFDFTTITGDKNTPDAELEANAIKWFEEQARKPFDLSEGPLLRVNLFKLSRDYLVLLTVHHIVTDGWSMNILIQELVFFYNSIDQNLEKKDLDELPIQYADYAIWQRNWFKGEILEEHINYWSQQLAGIPQLLNMPTDKPRPVIKTSNGHQRSMNYSIEKTSRIKKFSRHEGVTLYMFLLGIFSALLNRYSGEEDVCVGTAIANRSRPETEKLIGFFVNTIVMRTNLSDDPSFRDLLIRIRETTLDAYAHQYLPFEMLVDKLQPERNMSFSPLFQVGFDVQTAALKDINLPGINISPINVQSGIAAYDLLLSITDTSDGLIGQFEYNTDLFFAETIDRMMCNFDRLLDEVLEDPDVPISSYSIISEIEKKKIIRDWNNTDIEIDHYQCIHQRFEGWVEKQPDMPALYFDGKFLSYNELNSRANQLARYLRKIGIGPEKLVGILTERSMDTIIGILAVLKAGGAYLPLDPAYPQDRLQYMIQDAPGIQHGTPLFILTQEVLLERLSLDIPNSFCIDRDWQIVANEIDENLTLITKPHNLAYVIYTSGSTGKPKGTLLAHQGVYNLSAVQEKLFEISSGVKILQFSPLSFDASVWETFMALGNGATLYLARQEIISSGLELLTYIKQHRINVVTLPPSLLSILPFEQLPDLKIIIAAGEVCSKEIVDRWEPNRKFFNAYGPTETTVCASVSQCKSQDPLPPSIGKPLPNFRLYVVDKNINPVPIGVPGELLVGGIGVARGYINQPELTAEKFITNPFMPGSRLYRTGDLVRYRINGDLEYLGRIDQQVKMRGFRIELGEIENVLRQAPGVGDAVVIVREDNPGNKRLVGYLIPKPEASVDTINDPEVRRFIRGILPDYMIPLFLIIIPSFPLTPNGKVDRRMLPTPDLQILDLKTTYVAPRTPVERELILICEELLGIDHIGIYHNFFELGGHSLLATQFTSRIRDKFLVELPLRSLFDHPTIAELASDIDKLQISSTGSQISTIQPISRESRRIKRSELGNNS